MTMDEQTMNVVRYWLEKARDALASARAEARAGRLSFAVNRAYYSAFYAVSAVLLSKGERFKKHSGVRAALHGHLIKPGLLAEEWGRFYDRLFEDRQEADYIEFVEFAPEEVAEAIVKVDELLVVLGRLRGS